MDLAPVVAVFAIAVLITVVAVPMLIQTSNYVDTAEKNSKYLFTSMTTTHSLELAPSESWSVTSLKEVNWTSQHQGFRIHDNAIYVDFPGNYSVYVNAPFNAPTTSIQPEFISQRWLGIMLDGVMQFSNSVSSLDITTIMSCRGTIYMEPSQRLQFALKHDNHSSLQIGGVGDSKVQINIG